MFSSQNKNEQSGIITEPNGIKEIKAKEIEEVKKQKVSPEAQKKTVEIHKSSKLRE